MKQFFLVYKNCNITLQIFKLLAIYKFHPKDIKKVN